MTVRNGVLAMLSSSAAHGYGLKSDFEQSTLGLWPVNVGQIYTTLQRLEGSGLVESLGEDASGRKAFQITAQGRQTLLEWYQTPVDHREVRDELLIKVLVAVATRDPQVREILDRQRVATLGVLAEHTKQKMATAEDDLPRLLLLDSLILRAEAELRWLDLCEQRLARADAGTVR